MKTILSRSISPLLIIAALVSFTGCGKKAEPTPTGSAVLIKVRFQTDWFPQPEHGGYYQALAKGYYAAEGLDVEILPGGPNAQVIAGVATGRADLGMTDGDEVIVAVARGVPIKMVGAEMQRNPQGILFHSENPLKSLRDLEGKTLMAGAGSAWLDMLRVKLGVKFTLLPLVGDLARFMNNKDFVQQCFVTHEPFLARQRGADVGALLIASDSYEPYRVMIAGNEFLARHPDIVAKFVRASIKGWVDYLTGDAAPGNKLITAKSNDLTPEFIAYSIKSMNDYKLVLGDPAKGEEAGQLKAARLEKQIKLLQEIGVLDKPVELKDVVSFEFAPH